MLSLAIAFVEIGSLRSYAAQSVDMKINRIEFVKKHTGFNTSGGTINIIGDNLDIAKLKFGREDGFTSEFGTVSESGDSYIKVVLTYTEAEEFNGKLLLGSRIITLNTSALPYITGPRVHNYTEGDTEGVVFEGVNLDKIGTTGYQAVYGGNILNTEITSSNATITGTRIEFEPEVVGNYGSQNVVLSHEDAIGSGSEQINTLVKFRYNGCFRILEDLELSDITMYPNVAGKGDYVVLASDKFSNASNYRVYFLNLDDGDLDLDDYKMSQDIKLSINESEMSVKVPDNNSFTLGDKKVVIVKILNNEIVGRWDLSSTLEVVDADYLPVITNINPDSGSDEGSEVQIIGKNLLIPAIPSLDGSISLVDSNQNFTGAPLSVEVEYNTDGVTFSGKDISLMKRELKVTIGKQAEFISVKNQKQVDFITVKTKPLENSSNDPVKDVLVETITTIKTVDGSTYTFVQNASEPNGYKFISSSIKPVIESATPETVQVDRIYGDSEGKKYKMHRKLLLAISGKDFFVNKYTKEGQGGTVQKVNYPIVLIQKSGIYGDDNFVIKFNKNDSASIGGAIYVDNSNEPLKKTVANGSEVIPVQMVVINEDGEEVDGSVGNEVGSKILIYIPEEVKLLDKGKNYIQVVNPKRNSDGFGKFGVSEREVVKFSSVADEPVISYINPNIVQSSGGKEVVVKGSNFKAGVKVYLNAEEVTGVTRETSSDGATMTLKFSAPPANEGETQLQVINPDGGVDVKSFYYVETLGKNPELTSIQPDRGSAGTLVVANGNNFLKPDVAVSNLEGLNAYKLIGSRVFLDGLDVNNYNRNILGDIVFKPYSVPKKEILFKMISAKVKVSKFYHNTVIKDEANNYYSIRKDASSNPCLFIGQEAKFSFVVEGGVLKVLDHQSGSYKDVNVSDDEIRIGSGSGAFVLSVTMDNNLLRTNYNSDRSSFVDVSDYADAVILKNSASNTYYLLSRALNKQVILSNGKNEKYRIYSNKNASGTYEYTAIDKFGNVYSIDRNIDVDGDGRVDGFKILGKNITLTMFTPFVTTDVDVDQGNELIVGKKAKVVSKTDIRFAVPVLYSGTGKKDVEIINPDTTSVRIEDGYYYYQQPATKPIITGVEPSRGSVSGGYVASIKGSDFYDSTTVYIGGMAIPKENSNVSINGKSIRVVIPAYLVDISAVYGIGEISLPVTVVNKDGASYTLENGFTYVKPASAPVIEKIILDRGSSAGGEIVRIVGQDFRFFEPYINVNGVGSTPSYDEGLDIYTELNSHLPIDNPKWDNLLVSYNGGLDSQGKMIDLREPRKFDNGISYRGYTEYFTSNILPKVYFGRTRAKIVDYSRTSLTVISPEGSGEAVDVTVVNNDSGLSNAVTYTYESTNPVITLVNPSSGARVGSEQKEILGRGFYRRKLKVYSDDDASKPRVSDDINAMVRFGDMTNEDVKIGSDNDGRVFSNSALVTLDGDLSVAYSGISEKLNVTVVEDGKLYKREFFGFDGRDVFIPLGMLKNQNEYYKPKGFAYEDATTYNTYTDYELIRVKVDSADRRLIVSRGYAPYAKLVSNGVVKIKTPSYHSVGDVKVYFYNIDGGRGEGSFTYTNPATNPVIESAKPLYNVSANTPANPSNEDIRVIKASYKGNPRIEIIGSDFREGAKVYLGSKEATVVSLTSNKELNKDTLVVEVPEASDAEVGQKLPVIIKNPDGATAVSTDKNDLAVVKTLMYFVYQRPLSEPVIESVSKTKTSSAGGNKIRVYGSDFRNNSKVIIASKPGVKINPILVDNKGKYLDFITPSSMPVGNTDIQVLNADFGISTLRDAFTVVSSPTVSSRIFDEDGDREVTKADISGGKVLTLNGSQFQKGVKIYLGEARVEVESEGDKSGLYRNDKYYMLKDGLEVDRVEYIDDGKLRVTLPKLKSEKKYYFTAINPDGGISSGDTYLYFELPKPSHATNLKVKVVNDKYVELYDYKTDGVDYYNIYAYVGRKSAYSLKKNNYRDFKSFDTTSMSPYKIRNVSNFRNIKAGEKVYFVLKGVNQYGSSDYSNIVALDRDQTNKLRMFSDELTAQERNKAYSLEVNTANKTASVMFDPDMYGSQHDVDMTLPMYKNIEEVKLFLPELLIKNINKQVHFDSGFVSLSYRPSMLYNRGFKLFDTYNDDYAEIVVSTKQGRDTSAALSRLPRSLRVVSKPVNLDFRAQNDYNERGIGSLTSASLMTLNLKSNSVSEIGNNLKLYYYDVDAKRWSEINSWYSAGNTKLNAMVTKPGYYVIVKNR